MEHNLLISKEKSVVRFTYFKYTREKSKPNLGKPQKIISTTTKI